MTGLSLVIELRRGVLLDTYGSGAVCTDLRTGRIRLSYCGSQRLEVSGARGQILETSHQQHKF